MLLPISRAAPSNATGKRKLKLDLGWRVFRIDPSVEVVYGLGLGAGAPHQLSGWNVPASHMFNLAKEKIMG